MTSTATFLIISAMRARLNRGEHLRWFKQQVELMALMATGGGAIIISHTVAEGPVPGGYDIHTITFTPR